MKGSRLFQLVFLLLVSSRFSAQQAEDALTTNFYAGYNLMYSKSDSANFYFDKAIQISLKKDDLETALQVLEYALLANGYHYDLTAYQRHLNQADSILRQLPDSLRTTAHENSLALNHGNFFYKLKEYGRAKPYFKQIVDYFDKKPIEQLSSEENKTYESAVTFLASVYKNTGKYELAEINYSKAKTIIQAAYSDAEANARLTNIDRLSSQLYSEEGNWDKANAILNKLLITYRSQTGRNASVKNSLITIYHQLCQNLIAQDSINRALTILQTADNLLLEDDPFYKQHQLLYGNVLTQMKAYDQALVHYQNALGAYRSYRNHLPHQDVAQVYLQMGKLQLKKGDYDKGLRAVTDAFQNSTADGKVSKVGTPDPEKAFSKRQLLELFKLQINLLQAKYKQTENVKYLDQSLADIPEILNLIDLLKKEFESKLDKAFIVEAAYPLLATLLETTHIAYSKNPSVELLNLALQISEANKDIFLQEAIRSARATRFLNIPEDMILEESTYKSRIGHWEKQLFTAGDADARKHIQDTLTQLKNQYYSFLETLQKEYKSYYDLKYSQQRLRVSQVKNAIRSRDQAVISYTQTKDALYALVFSKDRSDYVKLPFGEKESDLIRDFHGEISTLNLNSSPEAFKEKSILLYKKILAPVLSSVSATELVIIPDGILHYLPFDVLMKDETFLVYSKAISYSDAIASWIALNENTAKGSHRLAAFAPAFEGGPANTRAQFGKLLHTVNEVEGISPYFETTLYKGEKGSLSNFLSATQNSDLLHLATHASANDEFPDYSYLAFSKEKDSVNTLYAKDLYNTPIPAKLVTLSACQTGFGKLQKGEGMVSLSKGFQYAGAEAIVKSLWKINDKSTVSLMQHFYENLSKGQTKSRALQQAKIAYLQSTDDNLLRHPHYWAAFSISGNTAPVVAGSGTAWIWFLTGSVLFLTLLFLLFRRKINPAD